MSPRQVGITSVDAASCRPIRRAPVTGLDARATRSRIMASIRGKDTAPELAVRRALHAAGLRFRLHPASLPGRPDIVLPRHRAVIFVHGCFWHRHIGCSRSVLPKANRAWWIAKLRRNRFRDRRNQRELNDLGWRVFVIWECGLERPSAFTRLVRRIRSKSSR